MFHVLFLVLTHEGLGGWLEKKFTGLLIALKMCPSPVPGLDICSKKMLFVATIFEVAKF